MNDDKSPQPLITEHAYLGHELATFPVVVISDRKFILMPNRQFRAIATETGLDGMFLIEIVNDGIRSL